MSTATVGRAARSTGRTRRPPRPATPLPPARSRRAAAPRCRSRTPGHDPAPAGRTRSSPSSSSCRARRRRRSTAEARRARPGARRGGDRCAAASTSGFPAATADEYDDLRAGGHVLRPGARRSTTAMPRRLERAARTATGCDRSRRPRPPGLRRRGRARSCPHRRYRRTRTGRSLSSGPGKRDQLLRDLVGRVGPRHRAHPLRHRPQARADRRAARGRAPARGASSVSGNDDRGTRLLEVAGVLRLVVGGRVTDTERAWRACPQRRGRTRSRRPGRARGRWQRGRRRSRACTERAGSPAARPARATPRSRALRRGGAPPDRPARSSSTTSSFRLRAPWLPPKTSSTGPSDGQLERRRPSSLRRGSGPRRDGSTGDAELRRPSDPSIGKARNTRRANGAASRLARPRCASASVSAARDALASRPRAPSGRRRSRRRRARRPAAGARGSRDTRMARDVANAKRPSEARLALAREAGDGNGSNSYPASGTSCASSRSGDPAKVTRTPRVLRASATAIAGST